VHGLCGETQEATGASESYAKAGLQFIKGMDTNYHKPLFNIILPIAGNYYSIFMSLICLVVLCEYVSLTVEIFNSTRVFIIYVYYRYTIIQ
jgi:hypothetical protein